MPLEAGAELRAQEGRPRAVQEARGKVIADAHAEPRASEITIIIPAGGVAMMDGTSTTDAAIERKVVAAVKRHAAVKVKLSYAEVVRSRAQAVEALVRKAGVKDLEITSGIVTVVPPSSPRPADTTTPSALAIAANGTYRIGTRVIPDAVLDKELAALAKQSTKLVLAPDASTTALVLDRIVQRAKAAGFTEILFTSR